MHAESHPMAGKTVRLSEKALDPLRGILVPGTEFEVEDWYDYKYGRGGGSSWQVDSTWTTLHYAQRIAASELVRVVIPVDDEVVYGHVRGLGHIVHASELGEYVTDWVLDRQNEHMET